MRKITVIGAENENRIRAEEAKEKFIRSCVVRNLSTQTIRYYQEDLDYFLLAAKVEFMDEITPDIIDDFIYESLAAGKRATSVNTRIK